MIGGLTYTLITRVFPDNAEKPVESKPNAEKQIRFDTRFEEAKFYKVDADKVRGDFTVRFVPITNNNSEVATIFIGIASFHDDEKVDRDAWSKHDKRCDQSPSCIHPPLVWKWDTPNNELIVRGGTPGLLHSFSATFDRNVKRVLLYWEFYQREADNGARCEIDKTRPVPLDGLPYVHSVKDGKSLNNWCYRAWDQKVVAVEPNT